MWDEARKPSEREHVCTYIYNNPEKFTTAAIPNPLNYSNLKWSIDRKNDLRFVQENDVKLMRKIKSYKGTRHSSRLPVRGQKTKSNFRNKAQTLLDLME